MDDAIKEFINGISVKVGKAVNFSTAALVRSSYKQVSKLLEGKHIPFAKEGFYCKGSFAVMHRGRLNADGCKAAAKIAGRIIPQEG